MSNCYSSQAEYDDHDFKDGICKDCGHVDKPAVKALGAQVSMLEAKVTELTERNRRLANQIRGYSDQVQESIRPLLAGAWDAGARAALLSEDYVVIDHAQVLATNPHRARADKLDTL